MLNFEGYVIHNPATGMYSAGGNYALAHTKDVLGEQSNEPITQNERGVLPQGSTPLSLENVDYLSKCVWE